MAQGKFGPASAALLLLDGYDILSNKVTSMRHKITSPVTDTTGLGDTFESNAPIGVKTLEVAQEGAFWDTTALYSHAAFNSNVPATPQDTIRIMCMGMAGNTIGYDFYGISGVYSSAYEVLNAGKDLTKVNVEYTCSGAGDENGKILQILEAKTADWNGATVDNAASSANGGSGYMQCTAGTGFSAFVGKIQHSADGSTWADYITFTDSVSDPYAERITGTGTVNRYLRFVGNVTGSGSITIFAGFSRS
tara:strand:- start:4927 stop:5673 length:747 start_codon:yes stop_codon:yes gene_type:complete